MTQEQFEEFAHDQFPGHKTRWGGSWYYISANKNMPECFHYELCDGKIGFHIEGSNNDWKTVRRLLFDLNSPELSRQRWGRIDCAWILDHAINNDDDIKNGFIRLHRLLDPVFMNYVSPASGKQEPEAAEVSAAFKTIVCLLNQNLTIPDYQRPYCWSEKNITALLEDITKSRSDGRLSYTIGSVILHNDSGKLNIVDGQQRITSLVLILKCLGYTNVSELRFNHSESYRHIKENYSHIESWFSHNVTPSERQGFKDYILNSCQMVEIIVSDLSEAFQMFESQNGRGKSLLPYNLLKAFHIRAMEKSSREEKIAADRNWESATMENDYYGNSKDILGQLFNEQIYRTRRWISEGQAFGFSRNDIDEFKGVTIDSESSISFPYQNQAVQATLAMFALRQINNGILKIKSRFRHGDPRNIAPFVSINQSFINGLPFFEYTETYVEIYKRLFVQLDSSQLSDFKKFYKEYCLQYPGAWRKGDTYIREAYKSVIMLLFDRFGEEGVERLYRHIYRCIYSWRLEYRQIRYGTMAKFDTTGWLCQLIDKSKSLSDMQLIIRRAECNRQKYRDGEGYEKIREQFRN